MNEAWKGAPWVQPRDKEEKKRTKLIKFLMDFLNGEINKKIKKIYMKLTEQLWNQTK